MTKLDGYGHASEDQSLEEPHPELDHWGPEVLACVEDEIEERELCAIPMSQRLAGTPSKWRRNGGHLEPVMPQPFTLRVR